MPAELFVDTSAWFALASPRTAGADRVADGFRERLGRGVRPVTTNLVVAETHGLLLRRAGRVAALGFVRHVLRTAIVVVSSSPELEDRAWHDWLERFDDQDFSFTDAVSFAAMEARGIREALALDHHFAVAGFTVVPGGR